MAASAIVFFGLMTVAVAADKPPAGKPVWSVETKNDLVRLGVGAGGKVVYARDDKKLTGLSIADGTVKYERALDGFDEKGFWGTVEDTTYVYSTSTAVVGVDIETGKDRWKVSPGEGIKANAWRAPRVGNPKALLLAYDNGVSVWDIVPGKVLWSAKESLNEDMSPSAWARDDDPETGVLLFLGKRTVFVGSSGKELWSAADTGNLRRGGPDVITSALDAYGRLLLVYLSKQVVLLNTVTGEVLASQTFAGPEAAADVETFKLGDASNPGPLLVTLGGRIVVADPKEGKVLVKTPENSILGQMAAAKAVGQDGLLAMTAVRGSDKTPNAGMHLYRVELGTGAVKWHAYNGGTVDTRQIMQNVVGEKVNGPFYLDKAKGVLLATDTKGVRLYNWEDGKERWAVDQSLPYSYRIMVMMGTNSFAVIRSMMQNRIYVPTNPDPVEVEGVVYVAGSDQVFAIDAATGQVKWTSKSKNLSLVSGMALGGNTLIARQGIYRDANYHGAPTVIVTRFLGPTTVEEPEVFIEEDPYGFVGLDAATGKESWSCLDFESSDPVYESDMPEDVSVCQIEKAKSEKGCKPSKLGVGGILSRLYVPGGNVFLGKSGIAERKTDACTAAWSVEGSAKKLATLYAIEGGVESKAWGYYYNPDPGYLVAHYGNDVTVVDTKAGKVLFAAGNADVVKVVPESNLLFAASGNNLSMYKLP